MAPVPVRSPSRPSLIASRFGLRKPLIANTTSFMRTGAGITFAPRAEHSQISLPSRSGGRGERQKAKGKRQKAKLKSCDAATSGEGFDSGDGETGGLGDGETRSGDDSFS